MGPPAMGVYGRTVGGMHAMTDRRTTPRPPERADAALRLLVGFSGSAASTAALQEAAQRAHIDHGRLVVVSVVTEPRVVAVAWPPVPAIYTGHDPEQQALERVRTAINLLSMDVSVVTIVCRGWVGGILVREAARYHCDAIVIGTRGRLWSRLTGVGRHVGRHSSAQLIEVQAPHGPRVSVGTTRSVADSPQVGGRNSSRDVARYTR
jgi:nucleotide-binding universal stress UspA family protein